MQIEQLTINFDQQQQTIKGFVVVDKIVIKLRHTPPTTRRNIRDRFILQKERVKLMHKIENQSK